MKKTNPIFDKKIGSGIEVVFDLIAHAYNELTEQKVFAKRSGMDEFAEFVGIYIYPANAKFEFFMGFFPSYYAITGIPLCFGIDAYYEEKSNEKLHNLLKNIILQEQSLNEYRNLNTIPICGITADKIDALSRNSDLANYFISLVAKSGYSLKLKD